MRTSVKIAVILIATFLYNEYTTAQERDWANFKRYEEQNKNIAVPTNVIFFGDSITELWVTTDPDFFSNNRFIGRGISGQTSAEMLVRFRPDVIKLKPKAVVILAGTNDIARNNGYISLQNTINNIISMAELAQHNGIKVVLCSVLPAKQFPWRKELNPAEDVVTLNAMIKSYAEKNSIAFVDYYSALVDSEGGLPKKYAADGIHPNIDAYKIMEEAVLNMLNK